MPKKDTDQRTLEETTGDLGIHYAAWKENEGLKNEDKERFWTLAVQACSDRYMEEILVEVAGAGLTLAEATARAEMYYPRHEVSAIRSSGSGHEVSMIERPEFMSFTYVNATDGMVYTRQIVEGSLLLDDKRLQAEDHELHDHVTFELPWGERVVRPFETLDSEQLSAISRYVYHDKPTVKLAPPRPAKEEELAEVIAE